MADAPRRRTSRPPAFPTGTLTCSYIQGPVRVRDGRVDVPQRRAPLPDSRGYSGRVNLHARFSSDSVKICVQDQIILTGSTRALMQVNPPPFPLRLCRKY